MITVAELDGLAQARLKDAKALLDAGRLEGATYLCGYSVEIALKARICRTLAWPAFPSTRREFEGLASFRTHDLDLLLRLSGQESRVKLDHFATWNAVVVWDSESRYRVIGTVMHADAAAMITAADALLKVL